jgi:signal transduction histidine kinase
VDDADGELAELAKVVNGMLGRLEQSFEQLRRFTSDASHELRTPLTAIRSVGEVGLQRNGSNDDYRDIIGSMLEEANRLTRLVDSLLTISRADASQIALHLTSFPAVRLMEECATLFEVLLDERGQQLIREGDEEIRIGGDWLLLRQAVLNVVHNAIKYSPAGGEIRMSVRRGHAGDVVIEVSDSGAGIPPGDLPRVFDRFYRVDTGRSREVGGVGLGPSIAKWTVEAHRGSLDVESVEGAGATFRIILAAVEANLDAARLWSFVQ